MEQIIKIRYLLWGPFTVLFFLATGLLLTIRSYGVQFWCWKGLFAGQKQKKGNGLTPLQALCTSLGGTMGVGNLAGVASAIALGGAGAVFYMLVAAFFGMATKYAELLLAVRYREGEKEPIGGPMVYLTKGAGLPGVAKIFAVCCLVCVLGTGAAAQGGAIVESVQTLWDVPPLAVGIGVVLLVLPTLCGGGKWIGQIATILVPVITVFYLAGGCWVLAAHWQQIPAVFAEIWAGAKEPLAAGGGLWGLFTAQAVSDGFSKGVFSHEAGMGSAPIAHGCTNAAEPCAQGLLGAVEVFLDTGVVCLMTALCLLVTDTPGEGLERTTTAFATVFGRGAAWFLAIVIVFLALATILGWSFYGLICLRWLKVPSVVQRLYPAVVAAASGLSALLPLHELLLLADIAAACMAFPNLIGLWLLSGDVSAETKRYLSSLSKSKHRLDKHRKMR